MTNVVSRTFLLYHSRVLLPSLVITAFCFYFNGKPLGHFLRRPFTSFPHPSGCACVRYLRLFILPSVPLWTILGFPRYRSSQLPPPIKQHPILLQSITTRRLLRRCAIRQSEKIRSCAWHCHTSEADRQQLDQALEAAKRSTFEPTDSADPRSISLPCDGVNDDSSYQVNSARNKQQLRGCTDE